MQKTQQDTFYLMPSVLIFSTEEKIFSCKSSVHDNTLPRERGFVGGGGGGGGAKKTIMAKNWRIFTCNVLSSNLKRRKKVKGH